jgi:hypothetical protein
MIKYKDNELIAEFMSMEDHQEMGEYVTPNYHKSWDWLMPVVEEIGDRKKWSLNYTLEWLSESQGRDGLYDIEDIFKAVVEFIEAHNRDKEKVSILKYLHDKGYAVEHLWHVHDVQQGYDCSDEIALKLLNATLGSDNVCEGVFEAMDVIASNEFKLKPKE